MRAQGFTVCIELFKPMTGRNSWAPLRAGKTGLKFGLGGPDFLYLLKEIFNTWGEAPEVARDQLGALKEPQVDSSSGEGGHKKVCSRKLMAVSVGVACGGRCGRAWCR